jgi:hypothetical protein
VVERALACCEGPEVTLEDLPEAVRSAASVRLRDRASIAVQRIREALDDNKNIRFRAAAERRISRRGLNKKAP